MDAATVLSIVATLTSLIALVAVVLLDERYRELLEERERRRSIEQEESDVLLRRLCERIEKE